MKLCANRHHQALSFSTGDHMFLKVSSRHGLLLFGKKGKLSQRFIGPFEILGKASEVAYHPALPP